MLFSNYVIDCSNSDLKNMSQNTRLFVQDITKIHSLIHYNRSSNQYQNQFGLLQSSFIFDDNDYYFLIIIHNDYH